MSMRWCPETPSVSNPRNRTATATMVPSRRWVCGSCSNQADPHDGRWQVSRGCLDKHAGVAHPETTGYSGRGSSEVTL